MASFDDLGKALRDDAVANAPRASAIDVDAVTRAARARRRPRQWAVGTLSVVAVLGFGGLAVAAVTPPVLISASESADLEAASAESDSAPLAEGGDGEQRIDDVEMADLVACGAGAHAFDAREAGLSLDISLPSRAPSKGGTITASAVLLNTSTAPLTLLTGTSVVAVLTQSGTVVGVELARDAAALDVELGPGESLELPMLISTLDCRGAGAEPLPSGTYGVTAVLDVLEPATGEWSLVIAPAAEIRLD